MTNIFEQASRKRIRFTSSRGQLNTEDLWNLPLEELDLIAKGINKRVKESSEESFIKKQSSTDKISQLQLDVVVSIINTKLDEEEKRKKAAEIRAKRNQLLELISQKENDQLQKKSLVSLRKELDELEMVEEEA